MGGAAQPAQAAVSCMQWCHCQAPLISAAAPAAFAFIHPPTLHVPPPLPLPQVPDRAHSDQLVLRRLALARGDPLKAIDAKEAVRAAANKVGADTQHRVSGAVSGGDSGGRARCASIALRCTHASPSLAPCMPACARLCASLQVASWLGQEEIRRQLQRIDPQLAEQLQALMNEPPADGGVGEQLRQLQLQQAGGE